MIFLRHPVTEAPEGLCYGRMDIGLGADAPAQIVAALEICPKAHAITSSPALRCRLLAEALANHMSASLSFDDRLWEMNFGEWEGLTWSEVPRSQSDPWAADVWNTAPPGGETFAKVCERVENALSDVAQDTLVVAHGGVIRAARIVLAGARPCDVWDERIPFATPIRVARMVS
ncbi:MAG: histidine phosphatase family protein [Paracoccaceae bacterium]